MKNSFGIISSEEYQRIMKKGANIEKIISKNSFVCDDVEELKTMTNDIQQKFFISQLKIINVLNREAYNKLCSMDLSTRDGLNYKIVTQLGNYRFNENCCIVDNILTRRYFILDFNKTITVDEEECTNQIFEVDMKSFCILICEICSAKQDVEDNLYTNEAKIYLEHMESIIKRFIKKHFELKELKQELYKREEG